MKLAYGKRRNAGRQPTIEKPEKGWILLMLKASGCSPTYVFDFYPISEINRTEPIVAKIEPTSFRLPAMLKVPS